MHFNQRLVHSQLSDESVELLHVASQVLPRQQLSSN